MGKAVLSGPKPWLLNLVTQLMVFHRKNKHVLLQRGKGIVLISLSRCTSVIMIVR